MVYRKMKASKELRGSQVQMIRRHSLDKIIKTRESSNVKTSITNSTLTMLSVTVETMNQEVQQAI